MGTARFLQKLLWIDGIAALVAGLAVLSGRHFWSDLLGLPVGLLAAQAVVTLGYAAYSLTLVRQVHKPVWRIGVLIAGNLAYALVVAGLLGHFYPTCTLLGVVYFGLEIVVVGGLGAVEWYTLRRGFGQ